MTEIQELGIVIPDDWSIAHLGEVTSKIGSGATPRGGSAVYVDSGVSLIRSQNIYDHEFKEDGLVKLDDFAAGALDGVSVLPEDVLINITGDSILRVAKAPIEVLPARVNQHVAIVRSNSRIDSDFLQKWLSTQLMKDYMLNRSTGGTRKAITKSDLTALPIPLPSIGEQQLISKVLSLIDQKILSSQKAIKHLSELSKWIFRDLKQAETATYRISDLVNHQPGKYLSRDDYVPGEYPVFGSNSVMGTHSEPLVQGPFMVLARIGSNCGSRRWSEISAWVNNNASALIPKNSEDAWVIRYLLEEIDMSKFIAGTSQPFIEISALLNSEVLGPGPDQFKKGLPFLKNASLKEAQLTLEVEQLIKLRDSLIPPLLTGTIRHKSKRNNNG